MKHFNTEGPVFAADHYLLPPLGRIDIEHVRALIARKKYFVLHAPRQTGKTTTLLALMEDLNAGGQYKALYVNVEPAQAAREDVAAAMRSIVSQLAQSAHRYLRDSFIDTHRKAYFDSEGPHTVLTSLLAAWAEDCQRPIVLMLDEVDTLVGDVLISLLRQLRAGYAQRPSDFPQSVILCGVRDVRDYRIHSSSSKEVITGGSAFNVKAESLRLGDFSKAELTALYEQHSSATGQIFEDEAIELAWGYTSGQPWLVNALAYEACFRMEEGKDRTQAIGAALMEESKERLVQSRQTHLDQLVDKLKEPRVRRVIEPMVLGASESGTATPDDFEYVRDLGLIQRSDRGFQIANSIYREVIPRELTYLAQADFEASFHQAWYVAADGCLDVPKLMTAFQEFFRENSEVWIERFQYKEAGPHLLLHAFLQRIVNGGGRIDREYGLGRMRTDLLVRWPTTSTGFHGPIQRVVFELKVLRKSLEATISQGLTQTLAYMDRTGADEGHLVIFNQAENVPWERKIFTRAESCAERGITVWGL